MTYRIPFNRATLVGSRARAVARGDRAAVISRATARSRSAASICSSRCSAADRVLLTTLLHARARDGGAPARHRAGRRGDRSVVHVRLDGKRLRAARREPVFADIRPDTLNLDERALDDARSPSGRGRSCRCTTPASAARWTPILDVAERGTASPSSRTTRTACSAATAGSRSARSARSRRRASTRRRTSPAARAARSSSTILTLVERAEILREKGTNRSRSSAARSTSTRGSTSARATCRPTCSPPSSSPSSRQRDAIQTAREAGSGTLRRRPRRLGRGDGSAPPVRPGPLRAAVPHVLPAAAVARDAAALIEHLTTNGDPGRLPLPAAAPVADGRAASAASAGECPVTEDVSDRLLRLPFYHGPYEQRPGGSHRDGHRVWHAVRRYTRHARRRRRS